MIVVDNRGSTDPRTNLALEEYVFRTRNVAQSSYVLLYVNAPSVVIGRHQNVLEEIDPQFMDQSGIRLIRRISGGGAVFHDGGNLNFSFITGYAPDRFNNYREFTRPIVEALHALGVPAALNDRNDIVAAGGKISGNAQFTSRERMLSHGTLLYDSNLDGLQRSLAPRRADLESKSTKSVRSRVVNISQLISNPPSFAEFQAHVRAAVVGPKPEVWQPSDADWQAVTELAEGKYSSWEWNYGRSPRFKVERSMPFDGGKIAVGIEVRQGLINTAQFSGGTAAEILQANAQILIGVRYWRSDVQTALQTLLNSQSPAAQSAAALPGQSQLLELIM